MAFPKKRDRAPKEAAPVPKLAVPEALLQGALDDLADALQIEHRRLPDNVWRWLVHHAPPHVTRELSERWKSRPDSLLLLPLTEKYSLACEIELKCAKGKLNTRQQKYRERMPVQVSRSVDETIRIVQQFARDVGKLRALMQNRERIDTIMDKLENVHN